VLAALGGIAPTFAIRGNNDTEPWARELPWDAISVVESGIPGRPHEIYLIHDLHEMSPRHDRSMFAAIVSGHSHRPSIERRDGTLFLNPGSAGRRRFRLPVTVARIFVRGNELDAEIVTLAV
jgi:predicted phosphodiesterase